MLKQSRKNPAGWGRGEVGGWNSFPCAWQALWMWIACQASAVG